MGCVFSYNVISNFDWVWDDRNFVKLEKKNNLTLSQLIGKIIQRTKYLL